MRHRNRSPQFPFAVAIALALACGVFLGLTLPMPASVANARYELALIDSAGEAFIVDYGLSLSDCLNRWPDFTGFTVACDRQF